MSMKRILIVDDDDSILDLLQAGIVSLCDDCQVTLARDGQMALDMLRRQEFDLILTDFDMPGLNGLEVAQAARQTCPQSCIALMSGRAVSDREQSDAGALEIDSFLRKPFGLAQLIQLLTRQAPARKSC